MVAHPILVERPIVVTPKGTALCRPASGCGLCCSRGEVRARGVGAATKARARTIVQIPLEGEAAQTWRLDLSRRRKRDHMPCLIYACSYNSTHFSDNRSM